MHLNRANRSRKTATFGATAAHIPDNGRTFEQWLVEWRARTIRECKLNEATAPQNLSTADRPFGPDQFGSGLVIPAEDPQQGGML